MVSLILVFKICNLKEFDCIVSKYLLLHTYFIFRADWPKTSYLKAIDYWVILCYGSVFIWLLEYCVILYLTDYTNPEKSNSVKDSKFSVVKKKVSDFNQFFEAKCFLKYGSEEKGSSLYKCSILLGFILSKNLRGL